MKLCASRAFWLVAYRSQGHEMLFAKCGLHGNRFAAGVVRVEALTALHRANGGVLGAGLAKRKERVDADWQARWRAAWSRGSLELVATARRSRRLYSFTLLRITADAHPFMRRYHRPDDEKRMIVVLREEDYDAWLDAPVERSVEFVRQCGPDQLRDLAPAAA